jgi:beta-exotoxin I transport system permease protein
MSVATRARPLPAAATATPSPARTLRAVVRRGLRDERRAPLAWGGSLGAMSGLMAALWPAIEGSMDQLMKAYPAGLKEAFNIADLNSVEAYVDAEMLSLIVPLAIAFLAVRIAARAISGAEERGYLDTLLAAPVARRTLVAGAFIVSAVVVAEVLAVITALTMVAGWIAGADPSLAVLGRGFANVWPLAMLFGGLALLAAGVLHRAAAVTAVAVGTLAAMYVLDLVGKLADPIEPLRAVSAFKYYGSAVQDGIDPLAFAGLALTGAVLAAAGALLFDRRDVR